MVWPLGEVYVVAFFVFGLVHYWVHKWRNPKCKGKLPPGSMGLPIIGETLEFFSHSKSIDIHPFVKSRIEKFGRIFKTSLVGRRIVVSADPDFNHYILQQEGRLVELWYLDSLAELLNARGIGRDGGPPSITVLGPLHNSLRNIVLNHVGSPALQNGFLTYLEDACRKSLRTWSSSNLLSLDVKKEISSMTFKSSFKYLYGTETNNNVIYDMFSVTEGIMTIPINIPGTVYHKCLKNRKKGLKLMKDLLKERRANPDERRRGDLIDQILDLMKSETGSLLNDDFAACVMFTFVYVSFDAISTATTLALIFLTQHPKVVKELEKEHEDIIRIREKGQDKVTWQEYKSMNFTMQVVNEVLRMSNIPPGLLRRAIKDIHYKGYTIPEGWTILISQASVMLSPETYDDPLSFNPWRWKNVEPSVAAKTFTPFGGGGRMCAGADFTKAFMAVFIHTLVLNYRFEKVKGGEVARSPLLGFEDGFYIKIRDKDQMITSMNEVLPCSPAYRSPVVDL